MHASYGIFVEKEVGIYTIRGSATVGLPPAIDLGDLIKSSKCTTLGAFTQHFIVLGINQQLLAVMNRNIGINIVTAINLLMLVHVGDYIMTMINRPLLVQMAEENGLLHQPAVIDEIGRQEWWIKGQKQ
jgi:hypothetical protein